jgi:hypothetical protein
MTAEESRQVMSSLAARAESRRRPRIVLYASAVLLVASIVAVLMAWTARASAARRLEGERVVARKFAEDATRLLQMRADATAGGGDAGRAESNLNMGSRLEAIAKRVGATKNPTFAPSRTEKAPRVGSSQRTKFIYDRVRGPQVEPLLSWVRSAVAEIPGLEVQSIKLNVEKAGWAMDVTFSRWERVQ